MLIFEPADIDKAALIVTVIVALSTTDKLSVAITRIVYEPIAVVAEAVTAPVEIFIVISETEVASLAF